MPLVYTERLREVRKDKNLTYQKMATLLGYKSKSTYRYIELGKTDPKLETMKKISSILEKPIGYFFNIEVREYDTN